MKKNRLVNPSEITQNTYSDRSAAKRTVDAGLHPKPVGLVSNVAKRICSDVKQSNVPVIFYNQTTAVVFISFGDAAAVAPTGPANGFPILAGEKCTVNSGPNTHAITSSASGIYAYSAPEEDEPKQAT